MTKQALIELRDKVAAGDNEGWRECVVELIDQERKAFKPEFIEIGRMMDGSLDAAVALLEAVLPGWDAEIRTKKSWACVSRPSSTELGPSDLFSATSDTPARALLLATLSALIEGAE